MDSSTDMQSEPRKPLLLKDSYSQSEVNEIVSRYRDSLTTREGVEKVYSREQLQSILDAVEANPKHRE